MTTDLLLAKHERDLVFKRIDTLQRELNTARSDLYYYRETLNVTRIKLIEIHNAAGAQSFVPDSESIEQSWLRCIDEILKAINSRRHIHEHTSQETTQATGQAHKTKFNNQPTNNRSKQSCT